MSALPPLPADDGSCRIEIFGPPIKPVAGDLWGVGIWGTARWAGPANYDYNWQDVTPVSVNAQVTWGADEPAGVLSVPSAGEWSLRTYDPQRILDPANYNSPYYPVLKPGTPMRIMFNTEVVRTGFVDTIDFEMASKEGDIRASDGVALMVKAKVPVTAFQSDPGDTLRQRAQWALNAAQVSYIQLEASGVNPLVGPALEEETSVWQQIITAALDALCAVWVDRFGVLRFRYFGSPNASGVRVGGSYIAMDSIRTRTTLQHMYNNIRTHDLAIPPLWHDRRNMDSIGKFGDFALSRDRGVPQPADWCAGVESDRSGVPPQYAIGTLRPQTAADFVSLLNLGMVDQIGLHVWSHGTQINRDVRVVGGRIEANVDSGWSAGLVTYEPSYPWSTPKQLYYEDFIATQDSSAWYTSEDTNSGDAGTSQFMKVKRYPNPAGSPPVVGAGESANSYIRFQSIGWTIARIDRAVLRIFRDQSIALHPNAKPMQEVDIRFITANWTEAGVISWATQPTLDPQFHLYREIPVRAGWVDIDVTAVVKRWAPTSLGGENLGQYGIGIWPVDTTDTAPQEEVYFSTKESGRTPYIMFLYER